MPRVIARRIATLACTLLATAISPHGVSSAPLVLGFDHINVAVADLDMAARRYRQLGFTLKPGQPHANGIRNQHAKFADGTEIELITAPEAQDALTTKYVNHIRQGDGPAFLSFFAPEMDAAARQFDRNKRAYRLSGPLLTLPEPEVLRYIFLGPRNHSPTDLPEHFRHANGAESLIGVWIAASDLSKERALLAELGATFTERQRRTPGRGKRLVAGLPQGEVVFLPGSRQQISGRRIVGATVRTRSLDAVRRVLEAGRLKLPPVVTTNEGTSMFLPPEITHGLWLEFRQPRRFD